MNLTESDYTLLPFYNPLTAAKFCAVFALLIIAFAIIRAIIYKSSMTLHRAPTAVWTSFVSASLIGMCVSSFLYWNWALVISAVIACIYTFYTSGEVKEANSDERLGVWGLNKDIRRVRGEIFNDMTAEEQKAYAAKVKPFKFGAVQKLLFFAGIIAIVLAFMFICNALDIGYLFEPVLIEK